MPHRCGFCDKVYSYSGSLGRHVRINHTGERHRCDYCIMTFTIKEAKRDHMEREHGVSGADTRMKKTFACTECDRRFAFEPQLKAHRIAEHTDIRFHCHFCDLKFKYRSYLSRHINRTHEEQRFNYQEVLKQGRDEWRYIRENKIDMKTLSDEKKTVIRHYLYHLATNKVIYGDQYLQL